MCTGILGKVALVCNKNNNNSLTPDSLTLLNFIKVFNSVFCYTCYKKSYLNIKHWKMKTQSMKCEQKLNRLCDKCTNIPPLNPPWLPILTHHTDKLV